MSGKSIKKKIIEKILRFSFSSLIEVPLKKYFVNFINNSMIFLFFFSLFNEKISFFFKKIKSAKKLIEILVENTLQFSFFVREFLIFSLNWLKLNKK